MPVKLDLELMPSVCAYLPNLKGKLINDSVDEVTGIFLVVATTDF